MLDYLAFLFRSKDAEIVEDLELFDVPPGKLIDKFSVCGKYPGMPLAMIFAEQLVAAILRRTWILRQEYRVVEPALFRKADLADSKSALPPKRDIDIADQFVFENFKLRSRHGSPDAAGSNGCC